MRQLITFLSNCYGFWIHVYRRRHAKSIRTSRFCNIFGGSPPFGPFWLRPCWGSVWPVQFFSSTVPLVFLSHLFVCLVFCLIVCQFPFIFRVEGGGRFPFVQISTPFLFREPFEGPIWSCWPQKRTFLGKEAARRRGLCDPSCGFCGSSWRIVWQLWPPKVTLMRNTTSPSCKASCPKPPSHPWHQPTCFGVFSAVVWLAWCLVCFGAKCF